MKYTNWSAICISCGILDSAPNGAIIEAEARLHKKDTKHRTFIGMELEV